MPRLTQHRFVLVLVFLCHCVPTFSAPTHKIVFIENKGQWPDEVRYAAHIPGGMAFFTELGLKYSFHDPEASNILHGGHTHEGSLAEERFEGNLLESKQKRVIKMHAFDVLFSGSDPSSTEISEYGELTTLYNYYLGNEPSNWGTGANGFTELKYNNLYECIDLKVLSYRDWLKYDIIISPGGDPNKVGMMYNGLSNLELKQGRLHMKTSLNEIIESIPEAYQIVEGDTIFVDAKYVLSDNKVSFYFPCGYDPNYELVIDPLLIFSSFSGSTADNFGYTAAFDNAGNLYSGGIVFSQGFPVTAGAFERDYSAGVIDIGILKFDSTGSNLLYATYLGGSGEESPHSLVVNNNDELIIFGSTSSSDFPTSAGAFDETYNQGSNLPGIFSGTLPYQNGADIFISKLSADGSALPASTYLGGSGDDGINLDSAGLRQNYGDQFRGDINVDEFGNIYLATVSASADFFENVNAGFATFDTLKNGDTDAIVLKMTPDLTDMIWGSYIGGDGEDAAYSIKFDEFKNVYISGGTLPITESFPTTAGSLNETPLGGIDGFVAKINANGDQVLNSTLIGTAEYDQVYFMDLDSEENIYIFGQTRGDYPVVGNVYVNPSSGQFIHKLTNALDSTIFSTVFGSGTPEPNISPTAFLVNECDNLYLSGWGGTVNNRDTTRNQGDTNGLPTTSNALRRVSDGSDFYLMSLSSDGSQLLYGTFYGSTNNENGGDHVDGGTSRFDKRGIVYQAACSCGGSDDNFPTTIGAHSRVNLGVNLRGTERCNNAVFKFDIASLVARFQTNTIDFSSPGVSLVCFPDDVVFQNQSIGGVRYEWDFGDNTGLTRFDTAFISHSYARPGQYTIKLIAIDETTCIGIDSTTRMVQVFDPPFDVGEGGVICEEDEFLLRSSGAEQYTWTDEMGNLLSDEQNLIVSPTESTTYFIDLENRGCTLRDSIKVEVIPLVRAIVQLNTVDLNSPGTEGVCFGDSILFENLSTGADFFEWDLGDGTVVQRGLASLVHVYENPGVYNVTLSQIGNRPCVGNQSVSTEVNIVQPVFSTVGDGTICEGESFVLQANGANTYRWTNENDSLIADERTVLVSPTSSTNYFVDFDQNGCTDRDTVRVNVIPRVDVQFEIQKIDNCFDFPTYRLTNTSQPAQSFTWDFGDGSEVSTDSVVIHQYESNGEFTVTLTGQVAFCDYSSSQQVDAFELRVPNILTPNPADGKNDSFIVISKDPVNVKILNRWGKLIYEESEYTDQWAGEGYPAGIYYYEVTTKEGVVCNSWLHLMK